VKKLFIGLLLLSTLASCSKSTKYGECVGWANEKEIKDSKLTYEFSKWNIFLAVIFSETILVPVNVVGYNLECPQGIKDVSR